MGDDALDPHAGLEGRRILIVEDELLLAMELRRLLEQHGCAVLGPVNSVAKALALLDRERPDAVLLDVNLNGQPSTPIAAALSARGVPFLVTTGYGQASIEAELQAAPHVEKPIDERTVVRLLAERLRRD